MTELCKYQTVLEMIQSYFNSTTANESLLYFTKFRLYVTNKNNLKTIPREDKQIIIHGVSSKMVERFPLLEEWIN